MNAIRDVSIATCIHTFAGVQLRAECYRQMNELRIRYGRDYEQPTAVPMLTEAYNLPAKKVIHIVGPIVQYKLTPELKKDLENCYRNTLDMSYLKRRFLKCLQNVRIMSAKCRLDVCFQVILGVLYTMDKEMRKTKSTSLPSPFLLQKNIG